MFKCATRRRTWIVYSVVVLGIFALTVACSDDSSTEPPASASSALLAAFESGSIDELTRYMDQWFQESVPVSIEELGALPAQQRIAYDLFPDFYNPHDLGRYGEFAVDDAFYGTVRYLIVQNTIALGRDGAGESIANFRPRVLLPGVRTVYLTPERERELDEFLDIAKLSSEELNARWAYVNQHVLVVPRQRTGWHFLTHPEVFTIEIDEDAGSALFAFRIQIQGGEAVYERIGESWQMTSSRSTWIE